MMEFIAIECGNRSAEILVDAAHMIYFHTIRNEQYHEGRATIPQEDALIGIREAALWVFSLLYGVPDIEMKLSERIRSLSPERPEKHDHWDKLLDDEYGVIEFSNYSFYASDLLFSQDPVVYKELALEIVDRRASGVGNAI